MSHQNRSGRAPNRRPPNGTTAWPGRFNETIFGPRFPHPGCQTLRLNQLKTGKQHGLTGSTDPFLTCISPHPAAKRRTWIPQRKQVFWLALPCIPCSIEVLAWFCYGCQTLRLNQVKTGKQHGLTGSTDPFLTCISPHPAAKRRTWIPQRKQVFWLALPCIPCSIEVLAWLCYDFTQKPPNSDPKRQISTYASQKTKKNIPQQGNSMAWPVQRTHFWHTCHPTPMPNYSSEVLILLLRQCHTKTTQVRLNPL